MVFTEVVCFGSAENKFLGVSQEQISGYIVLLFMLPSSVSLTE